MWQDLRFGWRRVAQNPGFTLVVALTLALGIGANSAVFSLVYATVLRPLPFPQADRLVWIATGNSATGTFSRGASGPELNEWRPQLDRIFEQSATVTGGAAADWRVAGSSDDAAHLATRNVSAYFFPLLGARALLGRLFLPGDYAPGQGAAVVLGYDCWQREFGGDAGVVGRTIGEDDGDYPAYTVIGVLPPEFRFGEATDIWVPQSPLSAYLAGLRAGISLPQAQAAMDTVAQREALAFPQSNRGRGIRLVRLRDHFLAGGQRGLWLLWAAAACLLLIACANVANLLLARAGSRQGEIAVRIRMALGAESGALGAMVVGEAARWTLLGVATGLVAYLAAAQLLSSFLFGVRPWDPATLVLAPALLLAVALLAAYLPARRAMRVDPVEALRAE